MSDTDCSSPNMRTERGGCARRVKIRYKADRSVVAIKRVLPVVSVR